MKKFLSYVLLLVLFIPTGVFASGYVSISTSSLTIEEGSTKSVSISAYNSIGDVSISSSNSSVASVSSSYWATGSVDENQTKGGAITVTGKSPGTATLTFVIDAATFDAEEIKTTKTVVVTVVAKKVDNSQNNPTPAPNPTPNNPSPTPTPNPTPKDDNKKVTEEVKTTKTTTTTTTTKASEIGEVEETSEVTTETTTTTVKVKESYNDLALGLLKIVGYDLDYDLNKINYEVVIDKDIKEVYIMAEPLDSNTVIKGIGTVDIENNRKVVITVSNAVSGHSRDYTINFVEKKESNSIFIIIIGLLVGGIATFGIGYFIKKNKKVKKVAVIKERNVETKNEVPEIVNHKDKLVMASKNDIYDDSKYIEEKAVPGDDVNIMNQVKEEVELSNNMETQELVDDTLSPESAVIVNNNGVEEEIDLDAVIDDGEVIDGDVMMETNDKQTVVSKTEKIYDTGIIDIPTTELELSKVFDALNDR